jgi:hypothetical protein
MPMPMMGAAPAQVTWCALRQQWGPAAITTAAQPEEGGGQTPTEGCVTVLLKQYCISVLKFD